MNKKCFLFISLYMMSLYVCAQTPQTPVINWATQKIGNNELRLAVSQSISPRVFRAAHPNNTEKVQIMFLGNWLDITDEVVVTGPGVSSPRGVTAGSVSGGNKRYDSPWPGAVYKGYTGAYTIVDFWIASDAAVGTHTVKLRRPRLGLGKDETVFYIEVYDAVRIRSIRYKTTFNSPSEAARSQVRLNATGTLIISGDNLNKIDSIGTANGMLSNVRILSKTSSQITASATFSKIGYLDYATLMNAVFPANLKNAEYPLQERNNAGIIGGTAYGLNISYEW